MKRFLSLLMAASLLIGMIPASVAENAESSYIAAPYNAAEVNPVSTYLEPVFYENENGPTIGVTTVGVISQDGLYFKDSNNNGELDVFEDWRLDAETRAKDMVTKMTLMEQAGFVMNALVVTPVSRTLAEAKKEDGTIDPAKIMTVIPEGQKTDKLSLFNDKSSGFAALDDQVMTIGKVRAGVYRGNLNFDASVVALYTNVATEIAEWDAAKSGTPAIPFTLISNPISAGFPDSLGMAAAVLGDGNYDAIREYAEVDRQMWRSQGIIFMYGPQIDLVTDPRWPRNSGTYGERPDVTAGIITALVDGYQYGKEGVNKNSVILSAKHFPGDGASENGFESHTSQGQWRLYPTEGSLEKYQLVGFQAAVDAGVGAIMPCYSRDAADARSVPQTYRGVEVKVNEMGSAYNEEIITKLLRDVMGFKGFVNSDSGITTVQCYGAENLSSVERLAKIISAGTDAIGAELSPEKIASAVLSGILPKEDLDRANVNRAKALFELGLFENAYLDYEAADEVRATNMATAKEQAYQLHLKSTVLMKNSEKTLPLAANAGTKIFIASYNGVGGDEEVEKALAALFENQGFEVVEKYQDAEVVYLYVDPKPTNSTNGSNNAAVLSLVEEYEVDEREMSGGGQGFGQGVVATQNKTGNKVEVTTVEGIGKIAKMADKVHENGGKVIATIVCSSPWILDNLEPYCDALLAQYTTSGASLANAYMAQVDVIVGNYNPTGKLSVTMVACEDVVALEEKVLSDGETYEVCASPNDVPGYDKDQYMSEEVLAKSPSGSYAYKDADGNLYVSGFGLSY